MDNALNARRDFVMNRLPWVTGFAALLLYLITLNHWVSFLNMAQVAKLTGFAWQSETMSPVYYLVSSPLRWLPARWVPLGANLLAALCGAVVVGLLTRSVALLPHDRTHAQRERESNRSAGLTVALAWLPPVFAALVCALQLSFWQHATNGTPDMVNLVLFAYVVRALLEFRIDERDAWLMKAALAYGALMTSDWMALGALPAFVGAVIWLRGLGFFTVPFLARMLLCGALGLALYLLLPLVASLAKIDPNGFWITLKTNLWTEKSLVMTFPKKELALMALTSFLPVLVLSLKWSSYFGDTSPLGTTLATIVIHIVHALLLLACVWVMFDPPFSPRIKGFNMPWLSLYFLSALSVGYYSGYFLLVFRPILARTRRKVHGSQLLSQISNGFVVGLAVLAPVGLWIKNRPVVRECNHSLLSDYARLTAEMLPPSGYLLADDPRRAFLMQAWLTRVGRDRDFVVVETWPMLAPAYNRHLKQRYGERWPVTLDNQEDKPLDMNHTLGALKRLAQAGELYYMHPSFGLFFEHYYSEPHGMLFRLQAHEDSRLLPPPLPAALLARNDAFWQKAADEVFPALIRTLTPPDPGAKPTLRQHLLKALKLPADPHSEAHATGALLSRTLNYWAVEVQKTGDLEKSAGLFELAQQLNPDNVVAQRNLEFNRDYRAGKRKRVEMPNNVEDVFGKDYTSWDQVLGADGPYDEPNLCYAQGYMFMQRGLIRQAAAAFERTHTFAPDDVPTRLWLAQLNLTARNPDRSIELIQDIAAQPERFEASGTNRVDALGLAARAHLLRKEPEKALALLETAIAASPTNTYLLANVTLVYSENQMFANALTNIHRQLALEPADPAPMLNEGFVYIQMNDYPQAIVSMTRLLAIQTNNPNALLNRAIAYLRNNQLDASRGDYETLRQQYPNARQIYFGLGEIAYRQQETNVAIEHYQSYLSNAVPGNAETTFVETRVQELRGGLSPTNKP